MFIIPTRYEHRYLGMNMFIMSKCFEYESASQVVSRLVGVRRIG